MSHHSTGLFDFVYPTWELDPTLFISSPSSVKFWRPASWNAQAALLKFLKSGSMEQGRIVSFFRTPYLGANRRNLFVFRNLSPDGSASLVNSYAVQFSQTYCRWVWYTTPTLFDVVHDFVPMPGSWILSDTWYKLRITWWNGRNLMNQPATVLRVEKFDGIWTQLLTDAYDTNERNKGIGTCRAGIGIHTPDSGVFNNWDDTEFWTPQYI